MTYIYAYSNNKTNLSRLRRMAIVYKMLEKHEIPVQMLTNDFRASASAARMGVPSCVNIQTIWDIDSVAKAGDSLIIDSPEDDAGKISIYLEMFKHLILISSDNEHIEKYQDTVSIAPLVDNHYIASAKLPKRQRSVLFFGDADSKKVLKSYADELSGMGLELLLGEFFYPGYDDELLDIFPMQIEADEYEETISSYDTVVTSSVQCAYEALASGARTIYMDRGMSEAEVLVSLESLGADIVGMDNLAILPTLLKSKKREILFDFSKHSDKIEEKIIKKIRV